MHNIRINVLDDKSIDRAIKELDHYEQELNNAIQVAMVRLADIGRLYMDDQFKLAAAFNHALGKAPDVTIRHIPNGMVIIAYGEQVGFLEFGTGDQVHTSHEGASRVPFSVAPGSWSQSEEGQKQYPPGWWYNGQYLTGTMAADAFPETTAYMRDKAAEIIKDTIGTWI